MAGKLRSTRQDQEMIALSSDVSSEKICLGNLEMPFCIQITWENGSGFSADVSLEYSNDDTTYVENPASVQAITDPTGVHMYDAVVSGAEDVRVKFSNVAGTADMKIQLNGKTRV